VGDYVRYRPGYPLAVVDCLSRQFGLHPAHRVADLGSGTGIFTELLLKAGNTVYAVEPNREMRRAAQEALATFPGFISVSGSAEATTLPDHSVDWITAAQAFHWFDVPPARREAQRILRSPGHAALIWNNRREEATLFLREYEAFLHEYAIDYARVKHQNAEADGRILQFFGGAAFEVRTFENAQTCDLAALIGRTTSASYMPAADHPRYPAMIHALEALFARHAREGAVVLEYDTRLYVGCMCSQE
jgi:SAM-dependent methyltransferase